MYQYHPPIENHVLTDAWVNGEPIALVSAVDCAFPTGAWAPIDLAKTYVLVTNDFIAAGQDGYTTLGTVYKTGAYVNTYLLYTQSFVDYVKAKGTIARPAAADYSHQKVISKAGVALP